MSISYAVSQLQSAASNAEAAEDRGDFVSSDAARARLDRWCATVFGIASGKITVGSRTPIRSDSGRALPVFLTPDVLSGGFASGRLRAGGALLPFEHVLADAVCKTSLGCRFNVENFANVLARAYAVTSGAEDNGNGRSHRSTAVPQVRKELNLQFFSTEGISFLQDLLRTRMYRIVCAEEAALLVVAWLVGRGEEVRAKALVRTLMPTFHLVRYYPRPAHAPISLDPQCSRSTVGQVRREMKRLAQGRLSNGAMRYCVTKLVIDKLAPAYDALVSLVLSTCVPIPDLRSAARDCEIRPFRKVPTGAMRSAFEEIHDKFVEIEDEVAEVRRGSGQMKLKRLDPSQNCGAILNAARIYFSSRRLSLEPRKINFVRAILQEIHVNPKRSLPKPWKSGVDAKYILTSPEDGDYNSTFAADVIRPPDLIAYRATQRFGVRADAAFLSSSWVDAIVARLDAESTDPESGLDNVEPVLSPCSAKEAKQFGLKKGAPLPAGAARSLRLLQRDSAMNLVERGLVQSMETLASLTGPLVAAAKVSSVHGCPLFRGLYIATNAAFQKRRSLLLLNLESQVRFDELPWARPLIKFRQVAASHNEAQNSLHTLLASFVHLCVRRWPHVMIPNKMLSALDDIARAGAVKTPRGTWAGLTDELAADIFMYEFSPKWSTHAAVAKDMLSGSLYDVYYGNKANGESMWNAVGYPEQSLAAMKTFCEGERKEQWWSVASAGAYIERSMVFTSQNYAYLFEVLEVLGESFPTTELLSIATKCFETLSAALHSVTKTGSNVTWQAKLRSTKNIAYGWRQLVFMVSQLNESEINKFFAATVSKKKAAEGCHLQRALVDLRSVWHGMNDSMWESGGSSTPRRRIWKPFYGWQVKGAHPIWNSRWCDTVKAGLETTEDSKNKPAGT